jgi:chromosomal replication initiation ATPase DnaA
VSASVRQLPLDLGHRPALDLGDFLVAECNQAAVAWLDQWPHWPASALILIGQPGCGKTHLAHVWQTRTDARLIDALELDSRRVSEQLGDARTAIVEAADRANEVALLHLYNLVAEHHGHLLLTAATPPARWSIGLADLRSRLLASPIIEVAPPDEALIGAVLVKLFADRQIAVGEGVVMFLLPRLERSFDAIRRIVAAVDAEALAGHRRVTVPLVRDVLQRLERQSVA